MFEHSIKVPRHYKIAANIFKKVSTEGGSVKTLLYDDKLRHFRTNVLFALITETIKHATRIDKILENSGILEAEPRFDPWLAKVLTAEILYGKKSLPGKSKPEQTILSYKDKFQTYINENGDDTNTKVVRRPRYVRINTNLLTTSDAIRAFQDEGYKFIRCTSGSYDDYLQQIQNLTEYDFTQDYHVKTVFVFSSGTKFHDHELYYENQIILQDKATAMAVHLLAPPPGSVVLDMCAAPGMKTTQLAAYIRNQGKIYAVERNKDRYETLCDFVSKTGSKCVETLNMDALELKRGEYDDVEYIILDPSCSGSGMQFSVHNYVEDTRMARLTSLQEKFLKHAMNAFPKAKRIVYSTCSLYPEENERVVTNVVKTSRAKWRVQDVTELLKGQWNNFGSGMYGTMGARCMYAKPETDLTTGFFLAVLDRDQNDMDKFQKNNAESKDIKYKNNVNDAHNDEVNNTDENAQSVKEDNVEIKKKVKKRKKDKTCELKESENIVDNNDNNSCISEDFVSKSKKKKKKKDVNDDSEKMSETFDSNKSKAKSNPDSKCLDSNFSDSNVPSMKNKKNKPESNIEIIQFSDSNNLPQKKKKKKKNKPENDADEESLDAASSNNGKSNDLSSKKNKTENVLDEESISIDTTYNSGSNELSQKKKKKHEIDNSDVTKFQDIQMNNSKDLTQKKKKNIKREIDVDSESLDTNQKSESNNILPKKKKKMLEDNIDAESIDSDLTEKKKKKKKSKVEHIKDSEDLTINVHFDHVVGAHDLPRNITTRRKHVD